MRLKKINITRVLVVIFVSLLYACARPITIEPKSNVSLNNVVKSDKVVSYVMSDSERSKEFITPAGGGDSVKYYPYRDLEKGLRYILKSIYKDVFVLESINDKAKISRENIEFIYTFDIVTDSKSDSNVFWPPTSFVVNLNSSVYNSLGVLIDNISVIGSGGADTFEWIQDHGLAGRRAAEDALKKFGEAILKNKNLR